MAEKKTTAKTPTKTAAKKVAKKATSKVSKAAPKAKKTLAKTPKVDEFAVIETGGKQYRVSEGDTIQIEKLPGEHKEGDKIVFDKVLLVDNGSDTTIGTPYIDGAKVEATLKEDGRAKKITVIQFKSKSRYFKKRGHRQPFFKVQIDLLK